MSTQWEFVEIRGNGRPSWSWRRVPNGGPETVSEGMFREFGMAVKDAIAHGFQPREDFWVTVTANGMTHYPGGRPRRWPQVRAGTQPSA